MNSDTVKGTWKQFKGKLKEAWGDLTDDELDKYEGKREQLVGALQKKYGQAKDDIETRLSGYERDANYDYRPIQPR
jgi:uncharacterized protein YjbJ (UPF0337 family)